MDHGSYKLIWWVLALPVFGFLVQALLGKIVVDSLGKKIGRVVMGALAVAPIAAAFGIATGITKDLHHAAEGEKIQVLTLFEWITVGNLSIPFEVRVDALSMTMVLIITGIGALIHLYATGYMAEEKDFTRFFTYLNLFVAAMLILVLGNNLALLFLGWEGVGVCSYLLIGFWYQDTKNSFAANKAFIVNRIGDWGLTLGIFMLVFLASQIAGSVSSDPRWMSYDVLLPMVEDMAALNPGWFTAACILLFIGAMGKSAQFPLYLWLPDAMAGPTPVSALIHAATMVTSGVFLLNRMSPAFEAAPMAMGIVVIVGSITALLGAAIAFGQTDIKKVLAFSTVSQLGYMFIACGVGAYWVGLFHVATHAFFKALLFLGSGAVIHAMAHNQDMRNYGGLLKKIPITAATMLVGWLAIAGLPFLSGAFSKEEILISTSQASVLLGGINVAQIGFWTAMGVALLTAAYMTRMTFMTFFSGEPRYKLIPAHTSHHNDHHTDHHQDHGHHHADHHHGPDPHAFFYTDAEMREIKTRAEHEHHHDLDENHQPHEVPWMMWVPLAALAVLSVVGGGWLFFGVNLPQWLESAGVVVHHHEAPKSIIAWVQKVLAKPIFWGATAAFALGVAWGYVRYFKSLPENDGQDLEKWPAWQKAASRQFGVDSSITNGFIGVGALLAKASFAFDRYIVDGVVNGLGYLSALFGKIFRSPQDGFVRGYAVVMQVGIVGLIVYFIVTMVNQGAAR